MCPGHDTDTSASSSKQRQHQQLKARRGQNANSSSPGAVEDLGPPDWESLALPPAHVLSHLTDAHCHPTDLTHDPSVYDAVKLGGLASMATIVGDQDKVRALSEDRVWTRVAASKSGQNRASNGNDVGLEEGSKAEEKRQGTPKEDSREKRLVDEQSRGNDGTGVGVVACFGYHPWFTHLYTLSSSDSLPTKEEHYTNLFLPSGEAQSRNRDLLISLLPFLPEPKPFQPLLDKLKNDISRSLAEGRLTMLGEVGLDGSARMRWPREARYLHPEYKDEKHDENIPTSNEISNPGKDGEGEAGGVNETEDEEQEWKRLTPFKVPMAHQRAILDKQMDLAVELGVNVSFHSVACAGPSLDALISMRDRHGIRFTNRVNVDLHSAGGWSAPFWSQAEKNLLNLYASPSIFITGRSPHAATLIGAISRDRLLVESDSHDVRLSDWLVWAAAVWVGRCKGWKIEGVDLDSGTEPGREDVDDVDDDDAEGTRSGQTSDTANEIENIKMGERGRTREWTLSEEMEKEVDEIDHKGNIKDRPAKDAWTIRTLEKNWARFMRLIED